MAGVIIIGAGPGIGQAVARRFARHGRAVGLVARSPGTLDGARAVLADAGVPVHGAPADAADEHALRAALDALVARLGVPEALVYNVGLIRADAPGELSTAAHQHAWATNVVGVLTAAAHLLPRMAAVTGPRSYLVTGGMPVAVPEATSLSLGKAGVRAATELLATRYGPAGIHVATVTVAGAVAPGTAFDPDVIAARYWELHRQAPTQWQREVLVDG